MKSRYILGSIVCATALLSACNIDSMNPFESNDSILPATEKHSDVKQPNTKQNDTQRGTKSDAKIIGDLIVLNKNEISASRAAKTKASSVQVKEYATFLYTHHTSNLQQTLALSHKLKITPEMDYTAARLQHDGEQEMTQLHTLSAEDFDKVFLSDMKRDHREALKVLDRDINKAVNPMLKAHLEKTRDSVSMHLQKAQAIK